jgi:hypothetical protein|tara:strand:- start:1182 stop:1460 length:279 start_codon:yes stop_codon:yes gene_type:complete
MPKDNDNRDPQDILNEMKAQQQAFGRPVIAKAKKKAYKKVAGKESAERDARNVIRDKKPAGDLSKSEAEKRADKRVAKTTSATKAAKKRIEE